ncbi:hypothetical protein PR048_002176 [Dryococelus australis]|uniref:Uncharacterized protein n=1 Tax=Dryococelus australis TaxID=614101 RepID=A0ABQ9IKZ9_9NEOP|nr:hypothetical protein PR048_002176 [Dryococelus australis]
METGATVTVLLHDSSFVEANDIYVWPSFTVLRRHYVGDVNLLASPQGDPGSIPGLVTPDYCMCESCRAMPLVGGSSLGAPAHPGAAPHSPQSALIGSQDLDVIMEKCRNARAGEMGYSNENPPTSGIIRHGSQCEVHSTVDVQHDTGVRPAVQRHRIRRWAEYVRWLKKFLCSVPDALTWDVYFETLTLRCLEIGITARYVCFAVLVQPDVILGQLGAGLYLHVGGSADRTSCSNAFNYVASANVPTDLVVLRGLPSSTTPSCQLQCRLSIELLLATDDPKCVWNPKSMWNVVALVKWPETDSTSPLRRSEHIFPWCLNTAAVTKPPAARRLIRRGAPLVPYNMKALVYKLAENDLWLDYSALNKANRTRFPARSPSGFSHVGIVPDDTAGRLVFPGISRVLRSCIPALLHTQLTSPSSAIKTSMGLGNGRSPRKPADQRHRPARFPHAKIRCDPAGDCTRIVLVGGEQANRSVTVAPSLFRREQGLERLGPLQSRTRSELRCGEQRSAELKQTPPYIVGNISRKLGGTPHPAWPLRSCSQLPPVEETRARLRWRFKLAVPCRLKSDLNHTELQPRPPEYRTSHATAHSDTSVIRYLLHIQTHPVIRYLLKSNEWRERRGEHGAVSECKGGGNGKAPRISADQRHRPRYDTYMRKSGSDPAGNRTRFALLGG